MLFRYKRPVVGAVVGAAVCATAAVVAAPLVIGAIGFGAGGIATGSMAASMMSSAAIANSGAIAAGSLVATLQSIGAVGLGAAATAGVAAAGAGVGATVGAGVGVVADLVSGTGKADGAPSEGSEGGTNNSDAMWVIVRESDGKERGFSVKRSEPLQGMFDQYYNETGLSAESVFFEFNGLRLRGSVSPAQLEIESDDVIKALRIL